MEKYIQQLDFQIRINHNIRIQNDMLNTDTN